MVSFKRVFSHTLIQSVFLCQRRIQIQRNNLSLCLWIVFLIISCIPVWSQETWEETGHGGSWYIWEIICKTWFLDFYHLLEIVTILSSPALGRQRQQGMDFCRMKQPSLFLFLSSINAVRRRKWDFTCPCILGHQRYDKGNHFIPIIDLAYWFLSA